MHPKRFEGKFGIPPSHPVESLLTSALYRLPESVNIYEIGRQIEDIASRVNATREREGVDGVLSEDEIKVLTLKFVRHYEDNGESAHLDIATMVDALVESPKFLESDKGSMKKLFELHEMKTLQKIAESRRKKAEQTSGEGLNPYENLFETSSGKYYLARLLNMPHLEDESTYMDHCVGTSTSYISKMKRGDVEIFSFRNKETDEPVVTIEYDCRSKRLLQVKAQRDRLPTLADIFSLDLIEAIENLEKTINDNGDKREVKSPEAVHLRHLLDLRDKQSKNEPFTKDDLVFLYEINEPIKGFDNDREPLIAELRKDRNAEKDMLTIFECTKDQIAHVPSEITENTKAYVGQLEPGIFQKLPEALEHVYTSFPEEKIRIENVEIGGKSKEQLISEMQASGINISDYAKSMMDNPDFITGTSREEVKLVRLTVADLGFKTSATTDQIYERAQALGLELCPPDTGPNYRLQYKDPPLGEWVRIGMRQIAVSVGYPHVFHLARYDDGLWLGHDWAAPGDTWSPDNEFVFRFRKIEA
jgi:hypothetical protein